MQGILVPWLWGQLILRTFVTKPLGLALRSGVPPISLTVDYDFALVCVESMSPFEVLSTDVWSGVCLGLYWMHLLQSIPFTVNSFMLICDREFCNGKMDEADFFWECLWQCWPTASLLVTSPHSWRQAVCLRAFFVLYPACLELPRKKHYWSACAQ